MVPHRTDLVITAGLLHVVIVRFATCNILNANRLLPYCIRNAFNDLHVLYFEHYSYTMCFGMFCRLYKAMAHHLWRDRRYRHSLV